MKLYKKSRTMTEFLVRLIISILCIVAVIAIFKKPFYWKGEMTTSFNRLVDKVNTIKDGELLTTSIFLDWETGIIGFRNQGRFEYILPYYYQKEKQPLTFFERPEVCPEGKLCICLCMKGLGSSKNMGDPFFCKKLRCRNDLKGFDFPDKILSKRELYDKLKDQEKPYMKNGFVILRSRKQAVLNPFIEALKPQGSKTIYIERIKNIVNICESLPCISEDIRNEIYKEHFDKIEQENKEKALKEFDRFIEFYNNCLNGQCEEFNLSLPIGYYIYYHSSNGNKNFYLVKGKYPDEFNKMEEIKKHENVRIFNEESEEFDEGNIFETFYEAEFSLKEEKIILEPIFSEFY
jgi:hypothetical protein